MPKPLPLLEQSLSRNDLLPFLIEALLRLDLRQAQVARLLRCSNVTANTYAKVFGISSKRGWRKGDPRNLGGVPPKRRTTIDLPMGDTQASDALFSSLMKGHS